MKQLKFIYNHLFSILLCCFLQMAGCAVYAQNPIPVVAGKELIQQAKTDTLTNKHLTKEHSKQTKGQNDSVKVAQATADSLKLLNEQNLQRLEKVTQIELPDSTGGLRPLKLKWIPNSTKATWLAVVFPGAGQIYNKKYWKLPIIYGGFAGCAYALTWNTNMYKDYRQAYLDIMDNNPNTNSHLNLLPPNYRYNESQLKELIRKRKDMYRRYRDMSIFAFVGVYVLSIIDAYVDAELSNFDITPDLSLRIEPTIQKTNKIEGGNNVGVQCSLRF